MNDLTIFLFKLPELKPSMFPCVLISFGSGRISSRAACVQCLCIRRCLWCRSIPKGWRIGNDLVRLGLGLLVVGYVYIPWPSKPLKFLGFATKTELRPRKTSVRSKNPGFSKNVEIWMLDFITIMNYSVPICVYSILWIIYIILCSISSNPFFVSPFEELRHGLIS